MDPSRLKKIRWSIANVAHEPASFFRYYSMSRGDLPARSPAADVAG